MAVSSTGNNATLDRILLTLEMMLGQEVSQPDKDDLKEEEDDG